MNENMDISDKGLDFIMRWESLRLTAYKPTPEDRWTLGYGRVRNVHQGDVCTPFEAQQWLMDDLVPAMACINARVMVKLDQAQFDALASLVFNVGYPSFQKSDALVDLNRGDVFGFIDQAFSEEHGWTHQKGKFLFGLYNRRQAEQRLFMDGVYENVPHPLTA